MMPKKKQKKIFVFLAVVLLIVILAGVISAGFRRRASQMAAMMNQVDTAAVESRTLMSSISATGTICSIQSKEITAAVNGVELTALYVEVGDYVQTGDLLCEFDTSDLEESLADVKDSLNNTIARSNIDLANAQRSLAEAQETRDIQNARNEQSVENAWNDYIEQSDKVSVLSEELNNLKNSQEAKEEEIEAKEKEIEDKEKELEAANIVIFSDTVSGSDGGGGDGDGNEGDLEDAVGGGDGDGSEGTPEGTVSGGNAEGSIEGKEVIDQLRVQLQSLQEQLQSIQNVVAAKENELAQARSTQDSLLSAYIRSAETKEDGIRNNDSSVLSKEASLESTRLSNSTAGSSERQQIENYQKQIDACTVTAPINGVVTNVNLEVGDGYNGTNILTIEDDSSYIIEAQIDEYDIGKVKVGQEVVIRTNATGDEELSGTVIHVAPRASTVQSQGSGSVTYTVKISVDTTHEMLRMDMTAKLSIILEKKENVLTVPYDAVREDEDGNFYVEIMEEIFPGFGEQRSDVLLSENDVIIGRGSMATSADAVETYSRIYVTKGIESDYYVEVSGEGLTEGTQVVVPKTEESTDIFNRMMQRGPMGGF